MGSPNTFTDQLRCLNVFYSGRTDGWEVAVSDALSIVINQGKSPVCDTQIDEASSVQIFLIDPTEDAIADVLNLFSKGKERDGWLKYAAIILAPGISKSFANRLISSGTFYVFDDFPTAEELEPIIAAAEAEFTRIKTIRTETAARKSAIGTINSGTFSFKTIQEARNLSTMLSLACPDPGSAVVGLSELMLNAVEHGNLEIGYEEKSLLLANGNLEAELERRSQLAPYNERSVSATFRRCERAITIEIEDEGNGFFPAPYFEWNSARLKDSHGRGIAMANAISFDELSYNEKGNAVRAVIYLKP